MPISAWELIPEMTMWFTLINQFIFILIDAYNIDNFNLTQKRKIKW